MGTTTTKEQMSAYLRRLQQMQQRLLGVAGMDIDTSLIYTDKLEPTINVYIFPYDEKGRRILDEAGHMMHYHTNTSIAEWHSKEVNDAIMNDIADVVSKLEAQ